MELYDAIFYRQSIKNYSNKKIKEPLMEEVKNICSNITYLNEDLNIKAHVVDRGHLIHFLMGKKCNVKAPHYILVTSNNGEDYLQNIGFAIEKVVLQLTTLGLATCWLENNLKREDVEEFIKLDEIEFLKDENNEDTEEIDITKVEHPQVIIAFGYPEEAQGLFRTADSKLNREKVKDMCKKVDKGWYETLESVRYAPSIKNIQPWFFYSDINGLKLYERHQKKQIEKSSKISMGIALRHFDIACENHHIRVKYEKVKSKKKIGKDYFISIVKEV